MAKRTGPGAYVRQSGDEPGTGAPPHPGTGDDDRDGQSSPEIGQIRGPETGGTHSQDGRGGRHGRNRRGSPGSPGGPADTARRRRQARRVLRVVLVLVLAFVLVTGWSLGRALIAPGGGTFSERVAEWARNHDLGPLVTFGEWLTYSPPKVGGKPSFALTGPSATTVRNYARPHRSGPALTGPLAPHRLRSPAGKPLRGEGVWRVLGTVHGVPAIYGTYLRPDRVHTSYVAGIVWMNQQLLRFELRPGIEDPGPADWGTPAVIPVGHRRGLLATFNGGFKIANSQGGFYLNGITRGSLQAGAASMVYYRDGQMNVGVWGQGVRMTPQWPGSGRTCS